MNYWKEFVNIIESPTHHPSNIKCAMIELTLEVLINSFLISSQSSYDTNTCAFS